VRMYVKKVALFCGAIIAAVSACGIIMAAAEVHYVYFDRHNLPDLGPFTRFEIATVGHIYDASDRPLIELALEPREISRYEDIPPVVRDAILAAGDKRFFSHNGIDYLSLPRVLGKVRVGMLAGRLARGAGHDELSGSALFPQGGSTITQQLVRGNFLRGVTARENSYELRPRAAVHRGGVWTLSSRVGGEREIHARRTSSSTVFVARKLRPKFPLAGATLRQD
jgi:membrane carboxypeptidase/penicillin-binding protein